MSNIPDIEYIKTVTVSGNWNYANPPGDTFFAPINVEFIPDEIKLKYVAYYDSDTNATDALTIIKSSLVDNHTIFAFPGLISLNQQVDFRFRNFKQIQGEYTFSIARYNGNQIQNIATVDSYVSLTFEFIKYHPKK